MTTYKIVHDHKTNTTTADIETVGELTVADHTLILDILDSVRASTPAPGNGKPSAEDRKRIAMEALGDMVRRTYYRVPNSIGYGPKTEDLVRAEARELDRLDMNEISHAAFKFAGVEGYTRKFKSEAQALDCLNYMKAGLKAYPGLPQIHDINVARTWKPSDF